MAKAAELVDKEKRQMPLLAAALAAATLSGFITYFFQENGVWQQWTYLLHTASGILLAIVLSPYIVTHFRRTLGIRRPSVLLSGILSVITAASMVFTGLHIIVYGQQESLRWIYYAHIISSCLTLFFLVAHIFLHWWLLPERRKQSLSEQFPTLVFASPRFTVMGAAITVIVIGLATFIYQAIPSPYKDTAAVSPYESPYGKHPFRPSQTETQTGGFLDVRRTGGSTKCGACHEAITREWQASMHAQAASDKSYQTNINLLAENKGIASTRYCEGCHAPVALLSGELSKGGKLDTPGHLNEGVSCMGCHGIDKAIHLKGVASYRMTVAENYLFSGRDGLLPAKIHNFLIRIQPRQHRKDMARPILGQPQMCATCHAQFMDKDMNDWGWVKMQDEYSAWLDGPYSKQSQQTFSQQKTMRCQDCHLPLSPLKDPSANNKGMTVSHRTLGANTAIPYLTGDAEQQRLTREFLQADKIRISIDQPSRQQAVRSGKPVSPEMAKKTEAPVYFYLGEEVNLNLIVTNSQVGHDFPGGTLDINEAWIHLRVADAQNKVIFESGHIQSDNNVDSDAHFYRALAIDRDGKHVWQHDLFNMVGDSYKKVVPAGGSDIVSYEFKVPAWAKGPLTASAVVRYRKFNNRYARWALKDSQIRLPITDMARDSISIALRIKKEAGK